jgi:HNH endonuclease
MKICIWCSKSEIVTTFENDAHTIPKSLGGKNLCESVCDSCNSYFGNMHDKLPSIETVIKETFNISRLMFLASSSDVGKNKSLARFKSVFFNVDLQKRKIRVKPKYSLRNNFQTDLGRQLRRGIFKIYLEERERQLGDGNDNKFNFIREFSRYNLGDYPVLYFKRKHGIMITLDKWNQSPELIMKKGFRMKYLIDDLNYFEFELLGHVLGIPISRHYEISREIYLRETRKLKKELFEQVFPINKFSDFDFTLNIMND